MKSILIGTTSVNRPGLHKDNIPGWYNWINELDRKKYDIHWFINIDINEKMDFTYDETKENYETIIKDIPTTFLKHSDGKGNFLKACQSTSQAIEKYAINNNLNKKDIIIIWLEDDWKLNTNVVLDLDRIIKLYMSNMCYINLSFLRLNYIHALAPGLISYKLWEKLHLKAWKEQKEHIDPEHCVGRFYLKKINSKYESMNNITIINKFKKPGEGFFNSGFLNQTNSYYTYDIQENSNIIKDNYIAKEKIKDKCKDIITFMRITSGCCNDIGRKFMEKNKLKKSI